MSVFSSKKRKPETPEQADQNQMAESPAFNSTNTKRVRKSAVKQDRQANLVNPGFVQLKQNLLCEERQTVMASFAPLLQGQAPHLLLPGDSTKPHPSFVTQNLVELRWQLAALENLYNRPSARTDVLVMGQEDTGQLGILRDVKEMGVPATLLREMQGRHTIQVAAGGMHSVALTADGLVYSWGCFDDGALGRVWPPCDDDEKPSTLPAQVTGMIPSMAHAVSKHVVHDDGSSTNSSTIDESQSVVMISAGTSHTMFLTISGNVYSTGMYKDPDSGKFSDPRPLDDATDHDEDQKLGSPDGIHKVPVHVYKMPGKAKFVASGGSSNAAILQDDSLVTWGMGFCGELARSADMVAGKISFGEKTTGQPLSPNEMEQLHMKVVDGKKEFFTNNILDIFLTPKPVRFAGNATGMIVTHVDMGEMHILVAARAPGETFSRAYSCGAGAYGKTGHGDEEPVHELTLIKALADVPIARVAAGQHHSLFLGAKGDRIYGCGQAKMGQLGLQEKVLKTLGKQNGDAMFFPVPIAFPNQRTTGTAKHNLDEIGRFVDISCGENHSFAMTTAGHLYSWGFGEYGGAGNDPNFRGGDKDIRQPRLNETWLGGNTRVVTHNAGGGAQHSLMVATRYSKQQV